MVKGTKRYAPLGSFAQDALQEYFREGRQVLMTKYHEEHDIVFVNHHGKPITPTGIEYVLNQMIKKAVWIVISILTCCAIHLLLIY